MFAKGGGADMRQPAIDGQVKTRPTRAGWVVLIAGAWVVTNVLIGVELWAALLSRWPTSWAGAVWVLALAPRVSIAVATAVMGLLVHLHSARQWLLALIFVTAAAYGPGVLVTALSRAPSGS
jgi:hypothetical protein